LIRLIVSIECCSWIIISSSASLLVVDAVVVMLLDDIKIMRFLFVSIRHSLRDDSTKRVDRKKKGARSCTLNCLIFLRQPVRRAY